MSLRTPSSDVVLGEESARVAEREAVQALLRSATPRRGAERACAASAR